MECQKKIQLCRAVSLVRRARCLLHPEHGGLALKGYRCLSALQSGHSCTCSKKKKCGNARHFHDFCMFVYHYRSSLACARSNVRQEHRTLLWLITVVHRDYANQLGKLHWKDKWPTWKMIKGAQANKQAHLSADKPECACSHTQSVSNTTFTHPSCNSSWCTQCLPFEARQHQSRFIGKWVLHPTEAAHAQAMALFSLPSAPPESGRQSWIILRAPVHKYALYIQAIMKPLLEVHL